jgi:hypothetical protein
MGIILTFAKRIPILLLTIFLAIIISSQVSAQEQSTSIGFAPIAEYYSLEAGESVSGEFAVWNKAGTQENFNVKITGFKQIENEPGTAIPLTSEQETQAKNSAANWFTALPQSVSLTSTNANSTKIFKYTITVPQNARNGTYFAKISFLSQNNKDPNLDIATVNNLLAGPVFLIKVGEDLKESLLLSPVQIRNKYTAFYTDRWFYEKPPVVLFANLENDGETYITPGGEIVLTNFLNQTVDRIPFNSQKKTLLNGSRGRYQENWSPDGNLIINGKLAIGPIRAKLIVPYASVDPGITALRAETSFWIIPWKLLLILIAIIVLIWSYISYKRRDQRQEMKKKTA